MEIDLPHDQIDDILIQVLIVIIGISPGVVIPVFRKEPVEDGAAFPLVFLEINSVPAAEEPYVGLGQDVLLTECAKVMLQSGAAYEHLVFQIVEVKGFVIEAELERDMSDTLVPREKGTACLT